MKQSKKSPRCRKTPPAWHADFEKMIPTIETHAKVAFRHLGREARDEMVQEVLCNSCVAFQRLVEQGRTDRAFPTALAKFAVRQAKEGRKVGAKLNVKDVASDYCQLKKKLLMERLDCYDSEEEAWNEILVEDRHAGPADTAAVRLDFSAWLKLLPRRLRKIAVFLANGETTTAAAERFHLSQGRISQLRGELLSAWRDFQGEEPALAAA